MLKLVTSLVSKMDLQSANMGLCLLGGFSFMCCHCNVQRYFSFAYSMVVRLKLFLWSDLSLLSLVLFESSLN